MHAAREAADRRQRTPSPPARRAPPVARARPGARAVASCLRVLGEPLLGAAHAIGQRACASTAPQRAGHRLGETQVVAVERRGLGERARRRPPQHEVAGGRRRARCQHRRQQSRAEAARGGRDRPADRGSRRAPRAPRDRAARRAPAARARGPRAADRSARRRRARSRAAAWLARPAVRHSTPPRHDSVCAAARTRSASSLRRLVACIALLPASSSVASWPPRSARREPRAPVRSPRRRGAPT